jgi:hypothetical protein
MTARTQSFFCHTAAEIPPDSTKNVILIQSEIDDYIFIDLIDVCPILRRSFSHDCMPL